MLELNDDEKDLSERIIRYIDSHDPKERKLVERRFKCLNGLGKAISQYPSVREIQVLRGVQRSEEHLIEALVSFSSPSYLLHIPTRVVAARSYLVAKFQAFSLLHILVGKEEEFRQPLRKIILSVIHTLMAEEVYFACLDDPGFSQKVKYNLANDLISLWDSGNDPLGIKHWPALDALWKARDSSPPAFGTMNGTSELLRLTINMGEEWHEFLVAHVAINETRWAMEEFLFGLSYEEIDFVRSKLVDKGINAIGRDEIPYYLSERPAFGDINSSDYRTVYNFYVDRRDTARFRQRLAVPGPGRTLEEIYLRYRIAKE